MRRIAGLVDDMLILLILAVTAAHVADFLSAFEAADLKWISVPPAIAMDGAIARSGYLYRVYKGQKQRQWALMGLLFFSASSVVFNYGYYPREGASLFEGAALASLFPVAVALLAYLKGQKDVAEQARARKFGTRTKLIGTLSERERTILRTFGTDPHTSLAEVRRVLGVAKTTGAGLVKNLIVAGYLRREGRRVYVLEGTDRGGEHRKP